MNPLTASTTLGSRSTRRCPRPWVSISLAHDSGQRAADLGRGAEMAGGGSVAGAVHGDHAIAARDQRGDERAQLLGAAAPAVDEVDGGSLAPRPDGERTGVAQDRDALAPCRQALPGLLRARRAEEEGLRPARGQPWR